MASIVNFSDAAAIGIHGIILLAKTGEPLNAIELSKQLGKSKHHIGKVMQRLVKTGFLSSYRGPAGGFQLRKKPEEIIMYDIYAAIEGEVVIRDCPSENPICPVDKCIFNNVVKILSTDFVNYMKNERLSEYI
jgi:Rrf2 family protein